MTAAEVLGRALLELADRGRATPCQGRRRDAAAGPAEAHQATNPTQLRRRRMTNDLALEMPPRSAGTRAGDEWPSHKHRARRRRQRRRHTERNHR